MPGVAVTGGFSQLLSKDYEEVLYDSYTRQAEEYAMIAKVTNASTNYVNKGQINGLGALQEVSEGGPTPYETPEQGNTKKVYFSNFRLGFQITRNMWDDDLTGHLKDIPAQLGKSAAYTRELEFADMLNNAFNTTYRSGLDSKALCANDHALIDGNTYDNRLDAALSQTSLESALDMFEGLVNEKNIPIKCIPKYLVIPYQLRWVAKEILGSEYKPYTADNEVNTLYDEGLQVVVNHYLTSSVAWFVVAAPEDHDLEFIWRKPLEFDSHDDFNTKNALFDASMRLTTDFWDWRGVVGSDGS